MATVTDLHPALILQAQCAQVCATWPGVVCHRIHADGSVDCCVYSA